MNCSFTFNHFERIIRGAKKKFKFSSFFESPDSTRRVYLRHDIDVSVEGALRLAEIESTVGVESTFFIPINSPYYNLLNDTQIRRVWKISELGHTIGFHVDERAAYTHPFEDIHDAILAPYQYLKSILPIEPVISFHMPSDYDFQRNRKIGEFINVYSDTYNNDSVKYLSDSGRNWREGCFCNYLGDNKYHSYQILIHPIWWNETELDPTEIYEKINSRKKEGLRVNLRNDMSIFKDQKI